MMSDTHDDVAAARAAVVAFGAAGVDLVLHAGDFASPGLAEAFDGLKAPFIGVCGNNDHDWSGLRDAFAPYGVVHQGYYDGLFGGLRVALMHELRWLHQLPSNKKYDIVVYGHSHHFDVRRGSWLLVNPGQCKDLAQGQATVAILDTESGTVRKVALEVGHAACKGRVC